MNAVKIGQRVIHNDATKTITWTATGRRRVWSGRLHCEVVYSDGEKFWPLARKHEDCTACAAMVSHDDCPRIEPVGDVRETLTTQGNLFDAPAVDNSPSGIAEACQQNLWERESRLRAPRYESPRRAPRREKGR